MRSLLIALTFALATIYGCGDDGSSPDANAAAAEFCQLVAGPTCNLVPGGVSNCTQGLQLCIQQNLTPDLAEDWARGMNDCLQFQTCGVVADCYLALPGC